MVNGDSVIRLYWNLSRYITRVFWKFSVLIYSRPPYSLIRQLHLKLKIMSLRHLDFYTVKVYVMVTFVLPMFSFERMGELYLSILRIVC